MKNGDQFLAQAQSSGSEEFRRLNPALFAGAVARGEVARVPLAEKGPEIATKAKRAKKMTRTEMEYEAMLKRENPGCQILFERYTLKLSNDCRYVPDFAIVHPAREMYDPDAKRSVWWARIDFDEVKGAFLFKGATESATRNSLTKPKLAAELFPWHRFRIAKKDSEGNWSREELSPA